MSHGFGSTKQSDACNVRKVAAADFCVDPMAQQYTCSGEGMMLRKAKAAQQRTHSKTQARNGVSRGRPRFGVRRCPAAFTQIGNTKKLRSLREAVLKLRRPLANPPGHLI